MFDHIFRKCDRYKGKIKLVADMAIVGLKSLLYIKKKKKYFLVALSFISAIASFASAYFAWQVVGNEFRPYISISSKDFSLGSISPSGEFNFTVNAKFINTGRVFGLVRNVNVMCDADETKVLENKFISTTTARHFIIEGGEDYLYTSTMSKSDFNIDEKKKSLSTNCIYIIDYTKSSTGTKTYQTKLGFKIINFLAPAPSGAYELRAETRPLPNFEPYAN
jgi:hypothetical protein